MINQPNPDAAAGEKNSAVNQRGDMCVPLSALSVDGTPPADGDQVEFTTKGKVSRVEGDHAYIAPSEVNGEPYTAPAEQAEPTEEESDEEMMRIAREADED